MIYIAYVQHFTDQILEESQINTHTLSLSLRQCTTYQELKLRASLDFSKKTVELLHSLNLKAGQHRFPSFFRLCIDDDLYWLCNTLQIKALKKIAQINISNPLSKSLRQHLYLFQKTDIHGLVVGGQNPQNTLTSHKFWLTLASHHIPLAFLHYKYCYIEFEAPCTSTGNKNK